MKRTDWISTYCRVFCGISFLVHGTPKILNLNGAMESAAGVGLPEFAGVPIALLEFFGGMLLVVGLLVRWVAPLLMVETLVSAVWVHGRMGWNVYEYGYEFALALFLLLLTAWWLGPSPVSIDHRFGRGRKREEEEPALT